MVGKRRRKRLLKKFFGRKKFKTKRKKTPTEKAWHLLKIIREGRAPHLTVDHPRIMEAALVVGVGRAIAFLKRPPSKTDIMVRGRRLPGSFQSKT